MNQPDNLLDPRHYDGVRRPALEAETLPAWCYTSKEWFDLEVKHIFRKSWILIGATSRVPNPGDFVTFTHTGSPVIVIRGRDNVIRAFANTCRHRGAILLEESEGTCKAAIKCPYHAWVYGFNGALQGAPDMEDSKGFDKANYGLIPIRLETWGPFMFINFDNNAPGLKEWAGEMYNEILPYDPENLVCTRRAEFDVQCNWKLYVENFCDVGHVKTVHKDSLKKLSDSYDKPVETEYVKAEGFSFFVTHAGTRTLLDGVENKKGFDRIPTLTGRTTHGSYYPILMPLGCIGYCVDSAWALEFYPLGPDRIKLVVNSCFHKDALKRPDFEEIAKDYYYRMDIAVPEDNWINELSQRGLSSPHATPGRIGKLETAIPYLNNWWLDQVLGTASQPNTKGARVRAA